MTKRLLITAFACLLVVAGLTFAAAPKRVTIAAQPSDLARNRQLTLFGTIASQREKEIVVLEARDCGQKSFRKVAEVPTVLGGGWSWEFFYPGITATLRAVWKGNRSLPVTVRDRAFVELRRPQTGDFRVSVRAKTPFGGRRVLFQRLNRGQAGGWTTVRAVELTETGVPPGVPYVYSSARFAASVPAGTLVRAVFPRSQARPCYLAGYSNLLRT